MLLHSPDLVRLGRRVLHPDVNERHPHYRIIKRVVDYAFAAVLAVVTLPLLAALAAIVRVTSRGPAFYTQTRVGKDGRLFKIIKLRTMYADAESRTGPVWAKQNDPRVTPFGVFLRDTHLDEIPQLFNVLKGDMSLVGPRPERPHFVDDFNRTIPHYAVRLRVRPGITGLAQVRHKYDETFDDVKRKLAYDLLYMAKMCFMVDIQILLLTTRKFGFSG